MINHVALIPDGNRRWAIRKNFPAFRGHYQGAKTTEKILNKALDLKINYFTIWAGSLDNLTKRKKEETNHLFKIYQQYFKKILKERRINQEGVKISVLGRWREVSPPSLKKIIQKVIEKTKNNSNYFLNILLAYDGKDEMLECIRKIAKKPKIKINEESIKKYLWTGFLPPVDLLIRTGCESDPHNSASFMMWQTSYCQYYFTKTLYPDFTPEEFERAIKNFEKRERRLGA